MTERRQFVIYQTSFIEILFFRHVLFRNTCLRNSASGVVSDVDERLHVDH